jgi:hypothetical protein
MLLVLRAYARDLYGFAQQLKLVQSAAAGPCEVLAVLPEPNHSCPTCYGPTGIGTV